VPPSPTIDPRQRVPARFTPERYTVMNAGLRTKTMCNQSVRFCFFFFFYVSRKRNRGQQQLSIVSNPLRPVSRIAYRRGRITFIVERRTGDRSYRTAPQRPRTKTVHRTGANVAATFAPTDEPNASTETAGHVCFDSTALDGSICDRIYVRAKPASVRDKKERF
jgi:hypothetical protein